jgi:hypothetical protein
MAATQRKKEFIEQLLKSPMKCSIGEQYGRGGQQTRDHREQREQSKLLRPQKSKMDSTRVGPKPPNSVNRRKKLRSSSWRQRSGSRLRRVGAGRRGKPNKQGARLPLWRRRTGACSRTSHACGRGGESSSRRRRPESSWNRTNRRGGEWRGRAFFFRMERKSFESPFDASKPFQRGPHLQRPINMNIFIRYSDI